VEKPSALVFAQAAAIEITRSAADFAQELNAASIARHQLSINSNDHQYYSPSSTKDNTKQLNLVYIAFGSNVGHRAQNITKALQMIQGETQRQFFYIFFIPPYLYPTS
jgi:hypothetical protein